MFTSRPASTRVRLIFAAMAAGLVGCAEEEPIFHECRSTLRMQAFVPYRGAADVRVCFAGACETAEFDEQSQSDPFTGPLIGAQPSLLRRGPDASRLYFYYELYDPFPTARFSLRITAVGGEADGRVVFDFDELVEFETFEGVERTCYNKFIDLRDPPTSR